MNKNTQQQIRSITWAGLVGNLALAAFKFMAGTLGHSQAVVADAVHSLSDSITDIAVIVGSHYWGKPPDEDHNFGHGRIETLVTIFIGFMLLAAGLGIAWEAILDIGQPRSGPPGWVAALAAAISIICKEGLYRWTNKAGKRLKSSALIANAWHHRLDAISSIPALVAVSVAIIFPHWSFVDLIGAVVVALLIVQAALHIIWPALREFMDVAASKEVCEEIKSIALSNQQVLQVHKIRTRYVGMSLQVDLHLVINGNITVSEGHSIASEVRKNILQQGPDVADVLTHIEPDDKNLPGQNINLENKHDISGN